MTAIRSLSADIEQMTTSFGSDGDSVPPQEGLLFIAYTETSSSGSCSATKNGLEVIFLSVLMLFFLCESLFLRSVFKLN